MARPFPSSIRTGRSWRRRASRSRRWKSARSSRQRRRRWNVVRSLRRNLFALVETTRLHSVIMSEENRLPLSVAIITLNEERNLPRCLESVRELAAEIVVVDSNSTDGTRAVAEKFGAKFEIHPWSGQINQCRVALKRCTQPWVLCLDADEALSPELKDSI